MKYTIVLPVLALGGLALNCDAKGEKSERSWWDSASNLLEKGVKKGVAELDKGVDAVGGKVEEFAADDEDDKRTENGERKGRSGIFGYDDEETSSSKKKKKMRGLEDEAYGEDFDMDRVKDDAEGDVDKERIRGEMRVKAKKPEELEKAMLKMRDGAIGTLYINHGGVFPPSKIISCLRGTVRGDLISYRYTKEDEDTLKLEVNWGQHIDILKAYKSKEYAAKLTPRERQTLSKARKIVDEVITPRMKTEAKVRAIHDYLVDHTEFDKRRRKKDVVDVLLEGKGVCMGYAHAASLLLNMAGVECRCVFGYSGEAHLWNLVKVEGRWYHLDVTWDDPVGSDELLYHFFLICDQDMMARTHRWNRKVVPATPALTPREMKINKLFFRTEEEFIVAVEKAYRQKRVLFRGYLEGGAKALPSLREKLTGEGSKVRINSVFCCKRPKDVITVIFE